ncbi:DUF6565 domain-containing protein [Hymenobacter chitinivorans]|uniref:DUF6565 domain-containing protein n=1 Tax=Hymenobacter chitinivorans DSM 11115 TaxID=1121954 RepID=A0A2M9BML0_9BACT|nr:DUF6565 domain-containing protein [Hymenobacter chitinivorans]PJJ59165.1 hypothetical protein CLV45_0580 [Hymenobacter chitinivorans DSM 11115]
MKRFLLPLSFVAVGLSATALEATAQQKSTPAKQPTASTPTAIERDLDVFSDWVNDKLDRAEVGVRRELPRIKEDFDRQSKRLDRAVDSLSSQGKREYNTQKKRYQNWESKQDSLDAAARQPETASAAQRRLLNETVTISRARANELPELYLHLVENTREQRKTWSPADWSAASAVLERLNARYEQVREQLPLEERVRIRSLQAEFRTLEKARDVKDIMKE